MSQGLFKYDIALSFAQEDAEIALQVDRFLRRKRFRVYNYLMEKNLGGDLRTITQQVFRMRSNYVVVFLSKNYKNGRWTNEEWCAILDGERRRYLDGVIIVRIDDTHMHGLRDSRIFTYWEENPKEIANDIQRVTTGFAPKYYNLKIWMFILTLIAGILTFFYLKS